MGKRNLFSWFTLALLLSASPLAQELGLIDGVYTDSQARRGRRVYRQFCSSCHAPNMDGGEMGPGLRGGAFIDIWDGEYLAELILYTAETMPQDNPGSLSDEDYSDVLSYVLSGNEFPAGDVDLTLELAEKILIKTKN